jgi:hypothetical protein
MANSIYNRSYAAKRLYDAGLITQRIVTEYNADDKRAWTILLDRDDKRVFITCLKEDSGGSFLITHKDGMRLTINTDSLNILIEKLNDVLKHTKD